MSRFFIVNTVDWAASAGDGPELTRRAPQGQCTGCAWLFRAAPEIDDVESALRAAVTEFFAGAEGGRIREREEMAELRWEEAIPWVPDEAWAAHGLTVLRHPEVERLLLDREEDLLEEVQDRGAGRAEARAEVPLPTP
jgi:hypothetical protein